MASTYKDGGDGERLVAYAMKEFEVAIRAMLSPETSHAVHAFDLGKANDGEMQSILILIQSKEFIDQLLTRMKAGVASQAH